MGGVSGVYGGNAEAVWCMDTRGIGMDDTVTGSGTAAGAWLPDLMIAMELDGLA